ncbi:MAG: DNA polymerase III subunit gamma/tau C-terminal domain-containing protein, partial [Marinobacter sp.]|uniref:DNA polymerase III subunit gamma/tau C-terminal domain-containing protein n=1 Tax=Marinobacter sp. TaxID=50741 RepID=UPI0039761B39
QPEAEAPQPETAQEESPEEVEPLPDTGEFAWERDFRSLGIVGMPGNLASNAAMSRNGDEIVLTIDEGHARLLNARHEEKIAEALRNRFGDTITLRIEQGDAGGRTPAAWEERQRLARQKAAEEAIRNDPAVQSIVERFEARVVEQSIRPA